MIECHNYQTKSLMQAKEYWQDPRLLWDCQLNTINLTKTLNHYVHNQLKLPINPTLMGKVEKVFLKKKLKEKNKETDCKELCLCSNKRET